MFHYLFPPLTIGLGGLIVSLEGLFLKTGDRQYEEAAKLAAEVAKGFTVGDPLADTTRLGPLSSQAQLERVLAVRFFDECPAHGDANKSFRSVASADTAYRATLRQNQMRRTGAAVRWNLSARKKFSSIERRCQRVVAQAINLTTLQED